MRTALVTGANRGIGLAMVKELLDNGYKVIALSKTIENLVEIRNENLKIYKLNLIDIERVTKTIKEIEQGCSVDILINNAGVGCFKKIEDYQMEEWNEVLFLNLTVPFILIKQFLPSMKKKKYGRIINIGSDADSFPFLEASAYCASKYGLRGMTECLRLELKQTSVNVTTISPGRVDTFFNGKYPGCRPMSLKPKDIAKQVLFILEQDERCNIEQIKLSSSLE